MLRPNQSYIKEWTSHFPTPQKTGRLKGVPHTEVMGQCYCGLTYSLGITLQAERARELPRKLPPQHSDIATARSIALFPQKRSPTRDKGSSLLMNTFLSALCSCSTAAKPTAEQKKDEPQRSFPRQKDHFGFPKVQQRVKIS